MDVLLDLTEVPLDQLADRPDVATLVAEILNQDKRDDPVDVARFGSSI